MSSRALLIAVATLGCAASPPSSSAGAAPNEPRSGEVTPATVVHAPQSAAPSATPSTPTPVAVSLPFAFRRVSEIPALSLAVGKPPKMAVLSRGEARVFDGRTFLDLPARETLDKELWVEIFFGRDDQPRLMGHRRPSSGAAPTPFYRRYKAGRFQPEPSELGPLAGPDGALYGVLGHADPEVVCRPSAFCLVKRTTGWGRAPAHAEPARILLAGGTAWALHQNRIERLERDAWVPVTPERAWESPISLFVDPDGLPWVVEPGRDVVTRLVKNRWETIPSALEAPRAIWGRAPNDVWLVGNGGAAHFDGTTFRRVADVIGPLHLIAFAPPDLWLAGEAGVYRGKPTKSE